MKFQNDVLLLLLLLLLLHLLLLLLLFRCWDDVIANLEYTKADGIMSAEGILNDPTLFSPALAYHNDNVCNGNPNDNNYNNSNNNNNNETDNSNIRNHNQKTAYEKLLIVKEYLQLVSIYPTVLKTIIFHVRRICDEELIKYQLMEDCLHATNKEEIEVFINMAIDYELKNLEFVYDKNKAKKVKEALERKKLEESKRKRYEERMIRKAKREKKPLDYYLLQGSENPTSEELEYLKQLPEEEAFKIWKEKHFQHCFAFHFDMNKGCIRDRTCSFLHSDARISEAIAYG